jgi:histidyl-tRNA synthetase
MPRKRGRPKKKKKYTPHLLRGIKDILPEEQKYFDYIIEKAEKLASSYGFEKITLPILEEAELFKKGVGLTSDIVQKEMFIFEDLSGNKIALRPEGTASAARAYLEHGMFNVTQPVKWFYIGPMFRYERPQLGRQRQFHQFGLEIIGSEKPVADAQIILFTETFLKELGLKFNIQINSLGCLDCRKIYQKKLVEYFKAKRIFLCKDCRKRLKRNPLRILDCKEENCQKLANEAPQIVDFLCEDCKTHFTRTLEFLDEVGVIYNLNPKIVRGLDYYTRTVFEIWPLKTENEEKIEKEETNQEVGGWARMALGGGGRYDHLIEALGGKPTPACGVAFGIERIIEEIKRQKIKLPKSKGPQIFVAQLSDLARQHAFRIFEILRKEGFRVAENLNKDSLRSQLEIANQLGVKLCLIIGHQEYLNKTVIIRDMTSGVQEVVDQEKIVKEIKKRL